MINKKIKMIQDGIKKIEKESKNNISKELDQRIHQIHGEMYGYLLLSNDINKNLDSLYKEITELNGDSEASRH